jgi:hypothetical protein
MVMTTFAEELPGVTGAAGLNMHGEYDGNPEQESVTAPLNEGPVGGIVRL